MLTNTPYKSLNHTSKRGGEGSVPDGGGQFCVVVCRMTSAVPKHTHEFSPEGAMHAKRVIYTDRLTRISNPCLINNSTNPSQPGTRVGKPW